MTTAEFLQRVQRARAALFTAGDLRLLLDARNPRSFHTTLHRLVAGGLLRRLKKGIFVLSWAAWDPFAVANLLRRPSYVSLESALNLHGLLVQTPRVITSVTTGRPGQEEVAGQMFLYRHLAASLWFGFEHNGTFLIATPEKAFLDWLYLASRGGRPTLLDDLIWKRLNRRQMDRWARAIPTPRFRAAYRDWLRRS